MRLNTVCQQAHCPNISVCLKEGQVTFLLLGGTCTRSCSFCAVEKAQGKKLAVDLDEPFRISEVATRLGLRYVLLTSVTRDDLEDGGAAIFARTIELLRSRDKGMSIEVLLPDFQGSQMSLRRVAQTMPEVLAHNLETVKRLYPEVRPQASYAVSLQLLARAKQISRSIISKSSLMLGLGETEEEVVEAMQDLRGVNCDMLTLGQYLAPSPRHYPVKEFIPPQQFARYRQLALTLGFESVLSGPTVRSSYQAPAAYYSTRTAVRVSCPGQLSGSSKGEGGYV
jgi:lipoic acid synthetase